METKRELHGQNGKKIVQIIEADAAGMRLEQYLRQRLHFSKAQIRGMKFRENGLCVDGVRVRISHILQEGECLEVLLEEMETSSGQLLTTEEPIEILYEDEDLIAVWKEAGLVVHPSHGHYADTLSNRVHTYFEKKGIPVKIRSIGRLDRDTSGIVVFAKNQIAAARLWEQKETGIFWKEYVAVCSGQFEAKAETGVHRPYFCAWETIDRPLGPVKDDLMRMCVSEDGKRAVTHYQVLQQSAADALVRVRIETGRTHQIRVHMASIGHPLVGDILYGMSAEKEGAPMILCAWKAQLLQPFTGERIRIKKTPTFILQTTDRPLRPL